MTDLAILIPTFNSGALLADSIASAAALPRGRYSILVMDNASTDGSTENLPDRDVNDAPIVLQRNPENLGRVQNWNRAVAKAKAMGARHVLFLMAGDLLYGEGAMVLRDCMAAGGAALGLASYRILDPALRFQRLARRLDWHGGPVPANSFLAQSLPFGILPFGPLNANIYDLQAASLNFDAADPTHTDHRATIAFIQAAQRPVIYLDLPITDWRARAGRFHASMALDTRLDGDLALIRDACRQAQLIPQPDKISATLLLRVLFHRRGNLIRAWPVLRRYARRPIAWGWLLSLLLRQLRQGTPWRIAV